jgi:hypothetical protein
MNFTESCNRLNAYYSALLESGGDDAVSLNFAVDAAGNALRQVPLMLLTEVSPERRQQVTNLRGIYELAKDNTLWDQQSRRGWLEEARELLFHLQG